MASDPNSQYDVFGNRLNATRSYSVGLYVDEDNIVWYTVGSYQSDGLTRDVISKHSRLAIAREVCDRVNGDVV